MVRISWTRLATDDLKSIAEYIARDSKRYAKIQVQRIVSRTKILKLQPQAGKIVTEVDDKNIKELIEGNYRIIYKIISPDQVDILTIHHTSRDLAKIKIQ